LGRRAKRARFTGTIVQDVKLAIRTLLRAPGFTVIVLTTLAVAIGANTAIFSVVDGVLLRPLPYPDADRIVTVAAATYPAPERTGDMPFSDRGYWHFVKTTGRLTDSAATELSRSNLR
jgi:hypothetical protein